MRLAFLKSLLTLSSVAALVAMPALAADKVKIGFVSTLSGPSAALGVDIREVAEDEESRT